MERVEIACGHALDKKSLSNMFILILVLYLSDPAAIK
jgi:hypothetical protein